MLQTLKGAHNQCLMVCGYISKSKEFDSKGLSLFQKERICFKGIKFIPKGKNLL